MLFSNKQLGVGAVVGAVALWYLSRKVGDVAESAIDAVNPLNKNNVIAGGVNAVGEQISGKPGWTLGGAIYDGVDATRGLWHDSDADRLAEAERRSRAQYEALARYRQTGGF